MMLSRVLTILLILGSAVSLGVTFIFFALASADFGEGSEYLFIHGIIRSESQRHASKLTPAVWTQYTLWLIVFAFQLAWVLYAHSLLCRKSWYKRYLFEDPPFLPQSFYGLYILSLIMIILWLFTKDQDFRTASSFSMTASTLCLLVCLYITTHLLWVYEDQLSRTDIWLTIVLVQNGLGLFSTWCWVLTLLNLDAVLVVDTDLSAEESATICLSIFLVEIVVCVCTDIYLSKKWFRYVLSPYIALVLSVVGMLHDNWEADDRPSYILAGVLCTLLAGCLAKLGVTVYWAHKYPLGIEATVYFD